jgi:hypothetical protein
MRLSDILGRVGAPQADAREVGYRSTSAHQWACERCGARVADRGLHSAWHAEVAVFAAAPAPADPPA